MTKLEYENGADYVETAQNFVSAMYPQIEFTVVPDNYIGSNGVGHVHFREVVLGKENQLSHLTVNIDPQGDVFSFGGNFRNRKSQFRSYYPPRLQKRSDADPLEALKGVDKALGLGMDLKNAKVEVQLDAAHKELNGRKAFNTYKLTGIKGVASNAKAKLCVYPGANGDLVEAWEIYTMQSDRCYVTYIDAATNTQILDVFDQIRNFSKFKVYPFDVSDPTDGPRTVLKDPWDIKASPYTWIDMSDITTLGNNAIAHSNPEGLQDCLDCHRAKTRKYNFDYDYDPKMDSPERYRDAAITQAFYTVNKCHDVFYTLGFNEVAGNFQTFNSRKGGLEGDHVIVNVQVGTKVNNAIMVTPTDGTSAYMWLYLYNNTTPVRDVAFERGIVIHEYTHGVSNRLTGGPLGRCLEGFESRGLGEGWSDFMALALGLKPSDKQSTDCFHSPWVRDNPRGGRIYPYSTNTTTNPMLYDNNNGQQDYYFLGTYWANVLFEIMWDMIRKHGRNDDAVPEFRPGTAIPSDGRYLTMKLVMDAMALQPCNPNMIHARDAILDADRILTGGKNLCTLWRAFARRGLGSDAKHLPGRTFDEQGNKDERANKDERVNSEDLPKGVCS
ncbi:extracellular elastinolytic metallo proteinase precursor [Ilyonectria robusta]|uniref:extracellular elastinolytic metallo proteinase precursor n=1 Tax=Ilyonectria robusta TaxID=1079257 RepID=UPI001E8E02E1|nr:extracellular elastinolytic metallo proteinase precursor [Ilyonectria robusta]KAH8663880.1 extracellular elastinolytic metallo proteinase precursor [Ilyonectria robusta]